MDKQKNAAFSAELVEKLKLKRALGRIQRFQAKIQGVPAGRNQAQISKSGNSFISDGL